MAEFPRQGKLTQQSAVTPEDNRDDAKVRDESAAPESSSTGPTQSYDVRQPRHDTTQWPKPGQLLLDRYRLSERVGMGGFGEVWQAHDSRLDKVVAIKIPRSDRGYSKQQIDQFLLEARKLASLRHRSIVTLYNVEEAAGQWYLISDFIAGTTLAEQLYRKRLTAEQSARLIADVAEALHAAHKKKLVHRDIKPANILVDANLEPYLTDFGLALTENEQLEAANGLAGTLAYMSPEQVRGETRYLDGRSDLYSLGVVFYELLTGERPLKGIDTAAYRDQILNRQPRPPRSIDETIPAELERICLKCLCKSVADRYTTALDLATELRSWLQKPVNSTAVDQARPAPRLVNRRYRTLLAGAGLAAAAFVAVAVFFPDMIGRPQRHAADLKHQEPVELGKKLPELRIFEELRPGDVRAKQIYPLLNREPSKLVWPLASPVSDAMYRPQSKQLSVSCQGLGLLGLGEVMRANYTFRIDIHQNRWSGGVGIFFGYQEQWEDDKTTVRFQRIYLTKLGGRAGQETPFQLQRIVDTGWKLPDGTLRGRSATLCGTAIGPLPHRPQQLEITVSHERLQSVRFGGLEFPDLCQFDINKRFAETDYCGRFGTCNFLSESLYQNAQIQLFETLAKDDVARELEP